MGLVGLAGSFALVQVGAVLMILVAALAWVGRWIRTTGPRGTRSIRLTADHAVHVVELGGRSFVVGTGPGAAPCLLTEIPGDAAEPGLGLPDPSGMTQPPRGGPDGGG